MTFTILTFSFLVYCIIELYILKQPNKTNIYQSYPKYSFGLFLLPLANSVDQIFTGSILAGFTELLGTVIILLLFVSYFYKNPTYIIEFFDFMEINQIVDAFLSQKSNDVTKIEPHLKTIKFSSNTFAITLKKVSDLHCSIKYSKITDRAIVKELNRQIEPIVQTTPIRNKWQKDETLALKIMLALLSFATVLELIHICFYNSACSINLV